MPIQFTDPATAAPLLAPFEATHVELPGYAVSWARGLRTLARERFGATGLPTLRHESWRNTDLSALTRTTFAPPAAGMEPGFDRLPAVGRGPRLVFVDGVLRPALSQLGDVPEGIEISSIAHLLDGDAEWLGGQLGRFADLEANPLVALNTALFADGAALRFGRGTSFAEPVELVFVSLGRDGASTAYHPRLLIVAEEGAHATVVEHHIGYGLDPTLATPVAEIAIGDGASLVHAKIQRESREAFHLAHTIARVGRDARYDRFILAAGGRIARDEVTVVQAGPGAECRLGGAYMVGRGALCDNTTFIDHAEPHGSSREVYKGVIDGDGRGVFQGKILVRRGAQKTDGHQLNRALLLSDQARIDAKPELEIFADDVKCSHGATAGELDEDQLFYLRARGIPADDARSLLIAAFLGEALDEIADERIRDHVGAVIEDWMRGNGND